MINRRNFIGITSLVIIILSLFIITYSSLNYLSCNSYKQRSDRRVEIILNQYDLENIAINEIYNIKEYYYNYGIEKTVNKYNLTIINTNEYSGNVIKDDYQIVYNIQIEDDVNLTNFYLVNNDEQYYQELPFDD